MTILGTRPEIIRLSRIIPLLDRHSEHILVDTGQNYDARLSELFFGELKVRPPDVSMGVRGSGFGDQVAQILSRGEEVLSERRPDRVLVLGDTNSGLMAILFITWRLEIAATTFAFQRRAIAASSTTSVPF